MTDRFIGREPGFDGPATHGFSVTPNNDTILAEVTRALYVGTAGDVAMLLASGASVTLTNVPSGTLLPVRAVRVLATGTTATAIVGLV